MNPLMSLSKSSQKFLFSWHPVKQLLVFQYLVICIALICIYTTGMHWLIKCIISAIAIAYGLASLRAYWRQPITHFLSRDATLFCQHNTEHAIELQQLQWQDWGYLLVLQALKEGKQIQWIWLDWQLNESEKRNLRLTIRCYLRKDCISMPSITTNPVL